MKTGLTILLLVVCFVVKGQNAQVSQLNKTYMSGKYDQAITLAEEMLKNDPDNIDAKLTLGRALADKGRYKEAIPNLKFAVERDKSWRKAWALGYLGNSYFMLGDYEKSEFALKSCIELNATRNATNFAYRGQLLFGYDTFFKGWKIKETAHIRFHFQNMSDTDIDRYMQLREDAYAEVNKFFNSSLPKKIDFFVWSSREDAKRVLRANLGFADPKCCIVHSHFQQTRGHELTHVISNYSSPVTQKTGLINEGTAVCFDLSNNDRPQMVADWMKTNSQKVDIKDIWTNWRKYPAAFSYPLAGLFIEKLINKFGKEKFLLFFTNQTYEHAKSVYGDQLDKLIEEFEKKYNG
ncbi:tetratricopeptide repeat protein [Puteibacter caeruleilacunae]|nr:tetratricopeptide repeat protein [Puteibacter caeruleilacunae]